MSLLVNESRRDTRACRYEHYLLVWNRCGWNAYCRDQGVRELASSNVHCGLRSGRRGQWRALRELPVSGTSAAPSIMFLRFIAVPIQEEGAGG